MLYNLFKLLFIATMLLIINIPIGVLREKFIRMSFQWLLVIHITVPISIVIRSIFPVALPIYIIIPVMIIFAIIGQTIGAYYIKDFKTFFNRNQ